MVRIVFEQINTATNPQAANHNPANAVIHEGRRYAFAGTSHRDLPLCEHILKILYAVAIVASAILGLGIPLFFQCFHDLTNDVMSQFKGRELVRHYIPQQDLPPESSSESSEEERLLIHPRVTLPLKMHRGEAWQALTYLFEGVFGNNHGIIDTFEALANRQDWPSSIHSATCCILMRAGPERCVKQQFVFENEDGSPFTKEGLLQEMRTMPPQVKQTFNQLEGTEQFAAIGAMLIVRSPQGELFNLSRFYNNEGPSVCGSAFRPQSHENIARELQNFGFYPDEVIDQQGTFTRGPFHQALSGQ